MRLLSPRSPSAQRPPAGRRAVRLPKPSPPLLVKKDPLGYNQNGYHVYPIGDHYGSAIDGEGTMERARRDVKITIFRLFILSALSLLAFQTWRLQIVRGEESLERANRNRFRLVSIPAPRGVIYDREGRLLIRNIPGFTVSVIPAYLPEEREEEIMGYLASLLNIPLESEASSALEGHPFIGLEQRSSLGIRDLVEEGRKAPFVP